MQVICLAIAVACGATSWSLYQDIKKNPRVLEHKVKFGCAVACAVLFGAAAIRQPDANHAPRRPRPKREVACASILDRVIHYWTASDPFTMRDLLNGGLLILGRTGSGKTSASGHGIFMGAAQAGASMLVLLAKPEDREDVARRFRKAGREWVEFGPNSPFRFNLLNFQQETGADSHDMTHMLMTLSEVLGAHSGKGGENEKFWESLKQRTFYNAVEVVRKAVGRVTAPDLQEFILGAANSPQEMETENWKKGKHHEYLLRAHYAHKTPQEEYDFQGAMRYWTQEYPSLDQKPRSSSLADVLNTLHVFCSGTVRTLLSGPTNVTPEVFERGISVAVNMPVHEYGVAGKFVNAAWKYAAQHYILKRCPKEDSPAILVWGDEFQNTATSMDPVFLAECRSHRGGMVALTQSTNSIRDALEGHGKHKAPVLLSQFATRVIHALNDPETASYAVSLIGQRKRLVVGGSFPGQGDWFDQIAGRSQMNVNFNEQIQNIVEARFFSGLRTGGPENGGVVDGVVVKSGPPFSNGEQFLLAQFQQEAL